MALQLTPLGRVLAVAAGLSLVGYGLYKYGVIEKLVPAAKQRGSVVPQKADLPDMGDGSQGSTGVTRAAMPGAAAGCTDKPEVRALIWAWNSQMGLMFANGGAQSTSGSLMCENGVNLRLIRQDD